MNKTYQEVNTTKHGDQKPPMVPGHPIWGSLPDIQKDSLRFYQNVALKYGDIARLRFGLYMSYQLNHPVYIQHVLQDNNRNFDKSVFANLMIKAVTGEGLLTSEGEFWRRQRRLIQPAFHRQRIASFSRIMTACAEEMLAGWNAKAGEGQSLVINQEMMGLTLRIVSKTLFSRDIGEDSDKIGRSVTVFIEHLARRIQTLFTLPERFPTPRNLLFKSALRAMDGMMYRVIHDRRASGFQADDLLSLLLEARDEETGQGMSDRQLRDEVVTIYIAGHETTAILLTWAFMLLSTHPEVRRRLHAELAQVLGGRTPLFDDLPNLPYLRSVVDETLRLYPPAWVIARRSIQADEIGGYVVPANAFIFFSPYVMHRHPAFWENPEGFDPERFAPGNLEKRPRYAYFPFGGGPRQCIGNTFALVEAQLILATVLQKYRLSLLPGQKIEPVPLITLRPNGPIRMTLHPCE